MAAKPEDGSVRGFVGVSIEGENMKMTLNVICCHTHTQFRARYSWQHTGTCLCVDL